MTRHATIAVAALFAVIGCLIWAGAARAEVTVAQVEADYAKALAWWGVAAPPQCTAVVIGVTETDNNPWDGLPAAARATQPPPGWSGFCTLTMFRQPTMGYGPCLVESMIRHEVGHLLGLGHEADPASIMYGGPFEQWRWCDGNEGTRPNLPQVSPVPDPAETDWLAVERRAWWRYLGNWRERCKRMKPGQKRGHCFREVRLEVRAVRAEYGS